jgi:magnesium-transporting ATPase (P-type)
VQHLVDSQPTSSSSSSSASDGGGRPGPSWRAVKGYARNSITTAVYTWWNFVPLSILFQFKKAANVWFAVHVSLMLLGQYTDLFDTSMSPFSTGSLLLAMLIIVSVVELVGECARRTTDLQVNQRKAQVLVIGNSGGSAAAASLAVKPWKSIKAGDLVKLDSMKYNMLPADVVLLASSKVGGVVNVETSGIDGETSLKTMRPNGDDGQKLCRALQGIEQGATASAISWESTLANIDKKQFQACIEYEVPNKSVETFNGSMLYSMMEEGEEAKENNRKHQQHEVTLRGGAGGQLLLRGSSLKQTQWALGVVVYCGDDTKLRMNSRVPLPKYSAVNRVIDQTLIIVAAAEVTVVICSVLGMVIWNALEVDPNPEVWWYLDIVDVTTIFPPWLASLFTFQILYNYMIPISMYAMIEIVNSGQALMIAWDAGMQSISTSSDGEHDGDEASAPENSSVCSSWMSSFRRGKGVTPATVRNPALCSELGQVRFVFSDKTGTLTQNKMELKGIAVAGDMYHVISNSHDDDDGSTSSSANPS